PPEAGGLARVAQQRKEFVHLQWRARTTRCFSHREAPTVFGRPLRSAARTLAATGTMLDRSRRDPPRALTRRGSRPRVRRCGRTGPPTPPASRAPARAG